MSDYFQPQHQETEREKGITRTRHIRIFSLVLLACSFLSGVQTISLICFPCLLIWYLKKGKYDPYLIHDKVRESLIIAGIAFLLGLVFLALVTYIRKTSNLPFWDQFTRLIRF